MNVVIQLTMKLLATVVAFTLLDSAAPALAANISVTAQRHGDMIDVNATALLRADAATAWRVLTDYDHYAEFIPDLRVSRVVARNGPLVTVEQTGDAALWMLRIPIAVTYEVMESPPNRLQSHAIGGSLRALASSYVLTATQCGVRLKYSGQIAPGFELFSRIKQIAVRKNIERDFQALADEIERRSAVGGPSRRALGGAMVRFDPAAQSDNPSVDRDRGRQR
jgi:ribosome-associated toxin RatA of RatAB toxin-antitoxin module